MKEHVDRKILTLMLNNPEISQKEIARRLQVTPPAVNSRIQRMRRNGVITGFAPVVDLQKLGYEITIVMELRGKDGKFADAANVLAKEKCVSSVYLITGDYDVLVVAKFKKMSEFHEWVQRILKERDLIIRTKSSLAVSSPRESVVPNEIS